ncbi:MAG: signal peptidase II [Abditibacteriales bacterium]|nr:signal peptidase II [Abditibacteriales bacterium]MDW8365346.1 signal peptidase II [Abditibacteriales bacterium]
MVKEKVTETTQVEVKQVDNPLPMRLWWFYAGALVVLLLDQITKVLVRRFLAEGEVVAVIPNVVHLQHVKNTGAAFGLFAGATPLLSLIRAGVCVFILLTARYWVARGWYLSVVCLLILGGAAGNLVDAVLFGAVTDFIDLDTSFRFIRDWPVFNVADIALSVGAVMLVGELLFQKKVERP